MGQKLVLLTLLLSLGCGSMRTSDRPSDYVNPFICTKGDHGQFCCASHAFMKGLRLKSAEPCSLQGCNVPRQNNLSACCANHYIRLICKTGCACKICGCSAPDNCDICTTCLNTPGVEKVTDLHKLCENCSGKCVQGYALCCNCADLLKNRRFYTCTSGQCYRILPNPNQQCEICSWDQQLQEEIQRRKDNPIDCHFPGCKKPADPFMKDRCLDHMMSRC